MTSCIAGRLYAVVNANAFNGVEPSLLLHAAVDFTGESVEERLARRQRYWLADVEYGEASA